MIDALLYSTRDAVRTTLGYSPSQCDIRPDGHPPAGAGDIFVAVAEQASRSTADNCLDERFAFSLTLTMRVSNVSPDRIGDKLLARKLAGAIGFNRRVEAIRAFMHMNWGVLQDANTYLVELAPDDALVYGFCEPARYRGAETPVLVGGEWFAAEESTQVALKSELRFEDCRRLQAIGSFS